MKQRRVGTFTLGIALILIGIMIPLALIFKASALQIIQFSPLILIVLGAEILVYAIRFKEEKLKYDGLSIFMVIMISVVTIGTSAIAPVINRVNEVNQIYYQQERKARIALTKVVDELKLDADFNMRNDSSFNGPLFLDPDRHVSADVTINSDKEVTKQEVASAMYAFVKSVVNDDISMFSISIMYNDSKNQYMMFMYEDEIANVTLDEVTKRIKVNPNATSSLDE
ncbi:hypothetical protein RBG61_03650 [Paludicola sp. MB14-C6]|uniref:hypothetical protein n=1 Tax=Paludihabitans sp. MB14-C6 TaxID=3070656 RepID=UPI0027DC8CC5|nr:hypothetical protein [Paludicola sp. MB14-C6]WMJ23770.1 hypothetical protein RBG61_03650 [Paludicola sp. MB14-C6]